MKTFMILAVCVAITASYRLEFDVDNLPMNDDENSLIENDLSDKISQIVNDLSKDDLAELLTNEDELFKTGDGIADPMPLRIRLRRVVRKVGRFIRKNGKTILSGAGLALKVGSAFGKKDQPVTQQE